MSVHSSESSPEQKGALQGGYTVGARVGVILGVVLEALKGGTLWGATHVEPCLSTMMVLTLAPLLPVRC